MKIGFEIVKIVYIKYIIDLAKCGFCAFREIEVDLEIDIFKN